MVKCLSPNIGDSYFQKHMHILESTSICPICLDEFIAPRITKCGHIFCLSCILRHLNTPPSKVHSKCPCCSVEIHTDQLRPVLFQTFQPPRQNQVMQFTRLFRTKNCFAPYIPVLGNFHRREKHGESQHVAPSMADNDSHFCRFNYVDSTLLMKHLEKELNQLQVKVKESSQYYPVEHVFYVMAIQCVQVLQEKLVKESIEEIDLSDKMDQSSRLCYPIRAVKVENSQLVAHHQQKPSKTDNKTAKKGIESKSNLRKDSSFDDDSAPSELHNARDQADISSDSIYHDLVYLNDNCSHFYQASDGQLAFLCKFNMNCLQHEYSVHFSDSSMGVRKDENTNENEHDKNSYGNKAKLPLPDTIEGNVIDVETIHLTPDVRKRMPCLSHLPLYTDVQLVELNLNHQGCHGHGHGRGIPVLSPETREKFKKEFEKRKKLRRQKSKQEKTYDLKLKKQEEERIHKLKQRYQMIDPNDAFFHSSTTLPPDIVLSGDDFGPQLGLATNSSSNATVSTATAVYPNAVSTSSDTTVHTSTNTSTLLIENEKKKHANNVFSFRNVCANNGTPKVVIDDFPSLSTSNEKPSSTSSSSKWRPSGSSAKRTTTDFKGTKNHSQNKASVFSLHQLSSTSSDHKFKSNVRGDTQNRALSQLYRGRGNATATVWKSK